MYTGCGWVLVFFVGMWGTVWGNEANRMAKFEKYKQQLSPCFAPSVTSKISYLDQVELIQHYTELLNITAQFRNLPAHHAAGYEGPWIENVFISDMIDRPLSYYRGMVPLFVQWIDYDSLHRSKNGKHIDGSKLFTNVLSKLRSDVIYFTVSQANDGLPFLTKRFPNVLLFSAGGKGNVPIPLIKGELDYVNISVISSSTASGDKRFNQSVDTQITSAAAFDVGFFGTVNHGPRKAILSDLMELFNT